MRNLDLLEVYRNRAAAKSFYGYEGDDTCGVFEVPYADGKVSLAIIASSDGDWDHVSVSTKNRCPSWAEMEHVKRLFFKDDETAMQLHVPPSDHRSYHPYCLHLWRPQRVEIPRPPAEYVAPDLPERKP